jgi:hypothetical protein
MTTSPIRSINFLKFFSNHSNQKNHHKDYFIYEKIAYKQLLLKYFTIPLIYEINIINNIIYNEKSHIVAKFKDYLIYDDNNEFLNEFYYINISNIFLKELINNNNKNNKIVFPNFMEKFIQNKIKFNIASKKYLIKNKLVDEKKK